MYRGRLEPERDFVSFALFVSFFPQLVAGPIEKASSLLPQLKEEHPCYYKICHMFAVGIDVSNGRSTVAVLRSKTQAVCKPFEAAHTAEGLVALVEMLNTLDGEVRAVMEHTGRYYESVALFLHGAGFFVSALNPIAFKDCQDGITVRRVKTDKADAAKIARFALDKWEVLREYTPMDTTRYELKSLNRQFQLASKNRTSCSNNLSRLRNSKKPVIARLWGFKHI